MPRRRPSLACTARRLLQDFITLARLGVTSRAHLATENLFLRKQLALYQERCTKARRPDPATRVTLVLLSRFLDWRSMLTVVKPDRSSGGTAKVGDSSGGGSPGPAGRRFPSTCAG